MGRSTDFEISLTQSDIYAVMKAGDVIKRGDLLSLGADSLLYPAVDPNTVGASLRPIVSPANMVNGLQIPNITITPTPPTSSSCFSAAILANGNIVIGWRTDPSVYFAIYAPDGTPVVAATVIEDAGVPAVVRPLTVRALADGGFAVAWSTVQGTATGRFAIFNQAGNRVSPIKSLETNAFPTIAVEIAQLKSGAIAVVYGGHNGTNYQPRFSLFTAAGAVVIANVVVDTTISASVTLAVQSLLVSLRVVALNDGSFVVAFGLYDATNTKAYFRRYDGDGKPLAARQVHTTNSSQGNGGPIQLAAMNDGGFVISAHNSCQKCDAAGAALGPSFGGLTWGHSITPLANGGYRIAVATSAENLDVSTFNSGGVQVGTTVSLAAAATGSNQVIEATLADGSLLFGVAKGARPSFTRTDASLNVVGSVATTTGGSGTGANSPVFVFSVGNLINKTVATFAAVSMTTGGVQLSIYNSFVQKLTPVGVANIDAQPGEDVQFQISGAAWLRSAFKKPYIVNEQGSSPPGQKMSILGDIAILNGILA